MSAARDAVATFFDRMAKDSPWTDTASLWALSVNGEDKCRITAGEVRALLAERDALLAAARGMYGRDARGVARGPDAAAYRALKRATDLADGT